MKLRRRFAAFCCLWAALVSTCLPILAQPLNAPEEISIGEAMSGRPFPLTVKLRDLADDSASWRQFLLPSGELQSIFGPVSELYQAALGPYLLFFTQGKTFRSGGQNYLVVYRAALPSREADKLASEPSGKGQNANEIPRLPAETALSLGFLNTATSGSFLNIAPFDRSIITPVPTPAQQAATQSAASVDNLKQIGLGLLQYTQDYDELFPPMYSATQAQIEALSNRSGFRDLESDRAVQNTVQRVVLPYTKGASIFLQPGTKTPYRPNASIARRSLASIEDTSTRVAFYEAAPDASGKRAVLFVDGHVERIHEADWPQIRRASLVTVRLTGAAALYYVYRRRQSASPAKSSTSNIYLSAATGRAYERFPDGKFQWLAPPKMPIEVPFETGQYMGLSKYQGYNGSTRGKTFGGYGASNAGNYPDAVPVTPMM